MRSKLIVPSLIAVALALFAAPSFAQTAPTCVQGKAGAAPTATITFTAPTQNTDGTAIATPVAYKLYVGTSSGTEKLAASALSGSPISVTTGLSPASTAYFYVTVVDAKGNESAPSNEVCKAFPASTPATVVITIQ